MKKFMTSALFVILILFSMSCGSTSDNKTEAKEAETAVVEQQEKEMVIHDPGSFVSDEQTALNYLKDGNERYIEEQTIVRDTNKEDRKILKEGQYPFAVIVTCADSRVSPEIYFDQKLGDLFVIRNAGNVVDETTLGSLEYAVEHLGTPLVVVVGHTSCGAITGAAEGGEHPENLQSIIERINKATEGAGDLDDAVKKNTESGVEIIKENKSVQEMKTTVLGACYDIETGEVSWLE